MDIVLKRVYEKPAPEDGVRILVDRLWPRGMSREKAAIDHWLRELGPSDALRKWFAHRPERWEPFKIRYHAELDGKPELVQALRKHVDAGRVTLLFATKETRYNNAAGLLAYLQRNAAAPPESS